MSDVSQSKVAGVILAAGASSRFGRLKQTLPWGNRSLVNAVIHTARLAGLDPLILVLGNEADKIKETIAQSAVIVIHNPDWAIGQSSSLKLGVAHLPADQEGALFLLSDQPQLSVNFVSAIVEEGLRSGKVVVPYVDDRRTSPVYFPSSCFDKFATLQGDQGGRQIISACPHSLLPWLDEWMARDIDTPADYEALCKHYGMPLAPDIV